MAKEIYYWLAFNYEDKASGVLVVKANSIEKAIIKKNELKVVPEGHLLINVYEIDSAEQPVDVYVTAEELRKQNYKSTKEV